MRLRVVKIGGALVSDTQAVAEYIGSVTGGNQLSGKGSDDNRCILVHGGGPQINHLHEQLGLETTMAGGIRVTPEASMPVVAMVLRGLVNAQLCAALSKSDIAAIGLSGADLGLYKSALIDRATYGLVGGPPDVDIDKLCQLLALNWVPVCCSLAMHQGTGELLNVNADMLADAISRAAANSTRVDDIQLDLVSAVPGVLGTDGAIVPTINHDNVSRLIDTQVITGGMIPKVRSALASIDAGASRVRIGNFISLKAGNATVVSASA